MKYFILYLLLLSNFVIAQTVIDTTSIASKTQEVEKGTWDFNNKVYRLESPPLFWQSPVKLPDKFIVDSTLTITINKMLLIRDKHYFFNKEEALVYFNVKIDKSDDVIVFYKAKQIDIDTYFYLDSLTVFNDKSVKRPSIDSIDREKKKKQDLDFVSGESNLSFDVDKGGFNMSRYIDLTISGVYEDSIKIDGHIYDENIQDRYMYEKEVKDVQDLQIKVDNGHGYFIGGDFLHEDTSMIFYLSRELRGVKAQYSGEIKSIDYNAHTYVGAESNISIHERINLVFGVKGPYEISEKNLFIERIKVHFEGRELTRDEDYTFDEEKGFIYLNFYFDPGSYIDIEYIKGEDGEGRSIGGGFLSLKKNFLYTDVSVAKGFGGVDKDEIIRYLPGDTLAIASGEEIVDYEDVSYGAYKKGSDDEFTFYTKSELQPTDTLYILYFYESGSFGDYKIDEIETYKSNGQMEVYAFDQESAVSNYSVGKIVRVEDDFILLNNKFALSADSVVNIDISKAELFRENSVYHAFYTHFDVTVDKSKSNRNFSFDKIKVENNSFYRDEDYKSLDNFRDQDYYYRMWNMETFENSVLNSDKYNFVKDEIENISNVNVSLPRSNIHASTAFLHFGDDKVYYNVKRFSGGVDFLLNHSITLATAANHFSYENWLGSYSKFNHDSRISLVKRGLTVVPFYNYQNNELGKRDSTLHRDHYGVTSTKNILKNLDIGLTLQRYSDRIEYGVYNIHQSIDTLQSSQALTALRWQDSINYITTTVDFFRDGLKDFDYTNFVLSGTRRLKEYSIFSEFSNTTELLESSTYQHMYVGRLNGSYAYDSTSNDFVFVGVNMGDIDLYEETQVVNTFTTNKSFMVDLSTDYIVSPFAKLQMLEISDKENLFPSLPTYENILSKSELNTDYKVGLSLFDVEDELMIYKKSAEFFKRYIVYDNDDNMYDQKFNLLYSSDDGYYIDKRFTANDITTNVSFLDRDRLGIFYNRSVDTTYVVNIVALGYESTYSLNNELDIIFGNSAELNRELQYDDKYEMLYTKLGAAVYYKLLTLTLLNDLSYRFGGDDDINVPLYFNTYKKGFNLDISVTGKSQVSEKLTFGLQSLTRLRKGEDPWFQVVLDGSYSF